MRVTFYGDPDLKFSVIGVGKSFRCLYQGHLIEMITPESTINNILINVKYYNIVHEML